MQFISSKDNRIIKEAASLSEKKYRDRLGLYLLEGPDPILEAFMHGGRPRFIFTEAGTSSEKADRIVRLAEERSSAVYELAGDVFRKISLTETPQGVIAVMEKKSFSAPEFFRAVKERNVLVLDRVADPGNMGTLLRTAEAMGFGGAVIVKGSVDAYSPKVVRAAAGSILRLPLLFTEDAEETLSLLKANGKTAYAAVMRSGKAGFEYPLARDSAIIIGNEGNGVSEEMLKASLHIHIPMEGDTESLNAALAGGMLMYESLRQRLAGASE
ncbi:MAG: RNA methyltransferase [Firmicutes bacterium]|nr:RNA methyltransferase [Bacillota bacterium]